MDILCRKKRKGQAEGRPTDKKQKQENAEEMALKVSILAYLYVVRPHQRCHSPKPK